MEHIDPKPTYHTVEMFRALDRGDIRFMWIQVTNPMVTMPKLKRYRDGAEEGGPLRGGLGCLPDADHRCRRRHPARRRCGSRTRACSATRSGGPSIGTEIVKPPGEAMSRHLAAHRGGATARLRKALPLEPRRSTSRRSGRSTAGSMPDPKHEMAPYQVLQARPGVQWPFVERQGDPLALQPRVRSGLQPTARISIFTARRTTGPGSGPDPTNRRRSRPTASIPSGSTPAGSSSTGIPARSPARPGAPQRGAVTPMSN